MPQNRRPRHRFILLILEYHRQVKMHERRLWPELQRTTIAGLGFFEISGVMMEETQVDMGADRLSPPRCIEEQDNAKSMPLREA